MPDSRRFLHPETIRRISRLDLRARHVVEGFLAGMHRSPYHGQSVEFRQHREYTVGDDLRHVDWKVWARQDRLYVKEYDEDTNLRCTMLVDVSASMSYGRGPLNKYEYACTVASCLAYLVLRQQDAVGCIAFDEAIRARVPIRSKRNHIHAIIDSLNVSEPREKTDVYTVLRDAAEGLPRRGMIVVMSDLLADPEGTLKGLRLLRQRGHDVLVFHVLDDDELDFPFSGPTRFEGLESLDYLNCNPRALREGYLAAERQFRERLQRDCAWNTIEYKLVRTSSPLDVVLVEFLSRRSAVMRGSPGAHAPQKGRGSETIPPVKPPAMPADKPERHRVETPPRGPNRALSVIAAILRMLAAGAEAIGSALLQLAFWILRLTWTWIFRPVCTGVTTVVTVVWKRTVGAVWRRTTRWLKRKRPNRPSDK